MTPYRHGATALAFGAALAVLAYSALRVFDAVTMPPLDPATVVYGSQSAFVQRASMASFFGVLASFPAFFLQWRWASRKGSDDKPIVVALLPVALALAMGAMAIQALTFP